MERRGIEINTLPTETTYYVGQTLDTKGLSINLLYFQGKSYTKTVTQGFKCTPTVLDTPGTQTIKVSYGKVYNEEDYATFTVNVLENKKTIDMSQVIFEDETITYDGQPHSIKIQGELPDGIISTTYNGNDQVNVGEYVVTANFEVDSTQYNEVESKTAKLIIRKADSIVNPVITEPEKIRYEGELLPDIFLSDGDTNGKIIWDKKVLEGGINEYTWTFVPKDQLNYNSKKGSMKIFALHPMREATCEQPAKCILCSYTEGVILPHIYTKYSSNNDATCMVDGTKTRKCINCGKEDTQVDIGSKNNVKHQYKNETCIVCGIKEIKIEVTSKKYEIDEKYITKITEKTKLEDLMRNIETNAEKIEVYTKYKMLINEKDIIATGMQIKLEKGDKTKTFTLIVQGDTNGDGQIKISDMTIINRYRLHKSMLDEEALLAGDVNGDGKVDIKDIVKMNRYRLHKIIGL